MGLLQARRIEESGTNLERKGCYMQTFYKIAILPNNDTKGKIAFELTSLSAALTMATKACLDDREHLQASWQELPQVGQDLEDQTSEGGFLHTVADGHKRYAREQQQEANREK